MSLDVQLDENGNPDPTNGTMMINGIEELRQSLEIRLLSQVGWAVNDVEFGVEWLDFFGQNDNADLAADKIAEALEKDDRIANVLSVTVTPDYKARKAQIHTMLQLADDDLIVENDDPNLSFDASIGI
ncbi:hypothetical protein LZY01_19710 [Levilactobacillus zymae]|uniref:Uncharacterized protein n=1 Tax=Levilactobacillus zymae TaxID=267363 RepID=A0ABQ0WZ27_9LACO|nr:hypothetical protein [Levilactobacillus zymae]KRL16504.1 hypothetical protein FD38_GL001357 [Levilactobacillus zymae DSM 19395]QFR61001.1 hypothetical protein LZ395_05405 [Levilactobacillus zymae]GEO72803.1 hypothetical protein LZY01_19710 [Levilactobacillus zymae]